MKKNVTRGSITSEILEPVLKKVGGLGATRQASILNYCKKVKGLRQISEVKSVKGVGNKLGDAIKFAYESYYYGL